MENLFERHTRERADDADLTREKRHEIRHGFELSVVNEIHQGGDREIIGAVSERNGDGADPVGMPEQRLAPPPCTPVTIRAHLPFTERFDDVKTNRLLRAPCPERVDRTVLKTGRRRITDMNRVEFDPMPNPRKDPKQHRKQKGAVLSSRYTDCDMSPVPENLRSVKRRENLVFDPAQRTPFT